MYSNCIKLLFGSLNEYTFEENLLILRLFKKCLNLILKKEE